MTRLQASFMPRAATPLLERAGLPVLYLPVARRRLRPQAYKVFRSERTKSGDAR
jgi:hypothetical protein